MQDKIMNLPKWAQEHIADLQRERDVSIRTLNEFCDKQTLSPFCFEDNPCTGEISGPVSKKHYVQAYKMEVNHVGISLSVSTFRKDCIELQWGKTDHFIEGIAFIPTSYMAAKLVAMKDTP